MMFGYRLCRAFWTENGSWDFDTPYFRLRIAGVFVNNSNPRMIGSGAKDRFLEPSHPPKSCQIKALRSAATISKPGGSLRSLLASKR